MNNIDEILSTLTPATPEEIAVGDSIGQKFLIATLRSHGFPMMMIKEILIEYQRIVNKVREEFVFDRGE